MTLTPTYHAKDQYCDRRWGIKRPTAEDLKRAEQGLLFDFAHYTITYRQGNGARIIANDEGLHACIARNGDIITFYTPGKAVKGCYCTHCLTAMAPHTRKIPPRLPPQRHLRRPKEST